MSASALPTAGPARQASIWLLLSDKQGDNRQVLSLAQGLPWPCERRNVIPRARYVLGKPWFRPSIRHLDARRSDPLQPPWPDVIITVGRRPSMAALWVRRRSKGHTRIILIGRQPRYLEEFALVIASCQYLTANDPRMMRIALPLDDSASAPAATAPLHTGPPDAARGDELALLVGGPTRTFRLNAGDATAMLCRVKDACASAPLRILTSRRTPPAVVTALQAALPPSAVLHAWQPGGATTSDYADALRQCSHFIVTGDSISMVCDVVRQGRPLAIFRLPFRSSIVARWHDSLLRVAPAQDVANAPTAFSRFLRRLVDARLLRLPRSFDAFYAYLYRSGCASDLDQGFLASYRYLPEQDLESARLRARAVIESAVTANANAAAKMGT